MEKRTSPVVCLAFAASLWMLPTARADISQWKSIRRRQPAGFLHTFYLTNFPFAIHSHRELTFGEVAPEKA
jgi:hypothetical protein